MFLAGRPIGESCDRWCFALLEIEMSTTETEVKISADTVAERILSAFDGQTEYLNGGDLVKAAGVGRQ
jgi:hypothetical protein